MSEEPAEEEPAHRVKGQHREGPIPAKEIGRIVLLGIPAMVIAWYFLRWLKHGF